MIIQPDSKFVMIGDSITDCDRAKPVGEGLFGALGNGYVSVLEGLLTARYPEHKIRVVNMGLSGNTVRDLKKRWQTDVIDLKPDWLSICIGINDVWRHYDMPLQKEEHVHIDEYKNTLDELCRITKPAVKGLILMTPYFIEPNRNDAMRAKMDEYGKVVKELSETYSTIFVDTQVAFDKILQQLHPMSLAWDRVHPNRAGHTVIARSILNALEYEW